MIAWAKATKDVPLAFGAGLTMTCDGTAVPVLPATCTAGVLQSALDEKGQPTTFTKVDAGTLLALG
jgi:branched-chain amino acid transport system substrate-binding protein